jgi:cytolysin (calcineurin-like family phosphatase)
MTLYRKDDDYIAVGERGVPYDAQFEVQRRGFEYIGTFRGKPDFCKVIRKRKDLDAFKKKYPLKTVVRVRYLETQVDDLLRRVAALEEALEEARKGGQNEDD